MFNLSELENIDLAGRSVVVRLGANVPVKDGEVLDAYRLEQSKPTLTYLLQYASRVIIISHIDNVEGSSLKPVADYLSDLADTAFVEEWEPENVRQLVEAKSEQLIVLENLRRHQGEKANDPEFAKQLSGLGEVYVNEAFAVAHRRHASIVGIPQHLLSAPGFLFRQEISELARALDPKHPFLFILGGAKFDTKIPLVEKFTESADTVFIGGALANAFFKHRGMEVGRSLVDDTEAITDKLEELEGKNNLLIPSDVIAYNPESGESRTASLEEVTAKEQIMDIGPESCRRLVQLIDPSALVVWNGPLGNYLEGFSQATEETAQKLAEASGDSVLGGGDTVAAVGKLELSDHFTFISTGGGAMLDFLTHETLPGIEAMEKSKSE